jgi:hypothetical protein
MAGIGSALNGGKGENERDPHDFYPTPTATTLAMLRHIKVLRPFRLGEPFDVWEPAAGEGHMVRALESEGYRVTASDIVDRGYGFDEIDFLRTTVKRANFIVTNPPFKLADAFIEHALNILDVGHLALILPSTFYHADGRLEAFRIYKPSLVLPFTWRIDSTGQGAPTLNMQWVVWSTAIPCIQGFEPLTSDARFPGRLDPLED